MLQVKHCASVAHYINFYLAILLLISLLIKILADDPFSRHCLQLAIMLASPFLFIDFYFN
jgi:hypothetical protein